jgi:hypothetical protein
MTKFIPISVNDITFAQYLDVKKSFEAVKELPSIEAVIQVAQHFVDANEIPIGEQVPDNFMFTLGKKEQTVTAMKVYYHVLNLINAYQQDNPSESFEYKGETYYISSVVNDGLNAQEGIITSEIERRWSEIAQGKATDIKGNLILDDNGNFEFSLNLRLFAVLCRKKGESIPIDIRERDKWLTERAELFKDIPMNIVLDVRFFLLDTMTDFVLDQTYNRTLEENPGMKSSIRKQQKRVKATLKSSFRL